MFFMKFMLETLSISILIIKKCFLIIQNILFIFVVGFYFWILVFLMKINNCVLEFCFKTRNQFASRKILKFEIGLKHKVNPILV